MIDQEQMWLSLLRDLTGNVPDWISWKNVESALQGTGDVDSVAPGEAWAPIVSLFRDWAATNGLGPVIECEHAPYLLHLVALTDRRPEFFELDVNRRKVMLGSTLFLPEDLRSMAIMDERGFRRLRPGAEGLLKLVQNGMHRDGRPDHEALDAKGVRALMVMDPEGVEEAAALFRPAERSILAAANAFVEGSWDRRALLTWEAAAVAKAIAEPSGVKARIDFRVNKRRCPVLTAVITNKRRIQGARDEWLATVAADHPVHYD